MREKSKERTNAHLSTRIKNRHLVVIANTSSVKESSAPGKWHLVSVFGHELTDLVPSSTTHRLVGLGKSAMSRHLDASQVVINSTCSSQRATKDASRVTIWVRFWAFLLWSHQQWQQEYQACQESCHDDQGREDCLLDWIKNIDFIYWMRSDACTLSGSFCFCCL